VFLLKPRRPPTSPLFPYTTLFRSTVGSSAVDETGCCAVVGVGVCADAGRIAPIEQAERNAASARRVFAAHGVGVMLRVLLQLLAGLFLSLALRTTLGAPTVGLCPLLRREYVADLGACRIHDLLHARSVLRPEQVHLLLASLENLVDARLLLRAHAEALVV